jgi:diguanylate cyclase (GGDEF)-like protein
MSLPGLPLRMIGVKNHMKKRKLIGVIISEVEELYQHRLLGGIITQCYALDYDVAIFSTFIRNSGLPEYKMGEKNIYNLINFELFDGIIVAGITLAADNLPQEIEKMLLNNCKCPVLYIDLASAYYPYIYTNDRKAMEQLTDHLIERHGVSDIFCLAADPKSLSTINRVAGFKDSLSRHGIPIDEDRISYDGEFYYPGGERLARDIISGKIIKPEAVMCISDCMAIGFVNEMTKNGFHVPEDILVTGFDATDEAAFCSTVITTYLAPIMQTGAEAVCELTRLMTGVRPELTSVSKGHLEIGQSCGCNDVNFMKRSSFNRLKKKNEEYTILLDSYMMESLAAVADFDECIKKFCQYLYLVKDCSDYYLCLCNNWDGSAHNYSSDKEKTLTVGYTNKMSLALVNENEEMVGSQDTFFTKDMLPDLWKEREKPKAYYFTPLHFNENTIGYSVLTYGDKVKVFNIIYRNWSRNIMNILEFNRTHRRLYRTSFRDVLTGIYNRRGLDQNLPNLINEAITQKKKLMIIMSDLDNLKSINDQYGHQEGDNIITVVANAFQSCSRGNDICARIGGDEFLVAGVEDDDVSQDRYMTAVKEYIEKYNMKSKRPYRIEISMGSVCDYITDDQDIKIMIDQADHIMYKNKAINKRRYKR